MKKILPLCLLLAVLLTWAMPKAIAQEKERSYLKLYYQKLDGQVQLQADLKTKVDGKFKPIVGAQLSFTNENENDELELGEGTTDANGLLTISVDPKLTLISNSATLLQEFYVNYKGDSIYQRKKASAEVIPIDLKMKLKEGDETNTVSASANFLLLPDSAVNEQTVQVLVKRMFGWHKIGEGTLDGGSVDIEVPKNLPGVASTELTFACQIENDEMGKVLVSDVANWGLIAQNKAKERTNTMVSYLVFVVLAILGAYLSSLGLKKIFK